MTGIVVDEVLELVFLDLLVHIITLLRWYSGLLHCPCCPLTDRDAIDFVGGVEAHQVAKCLLGLRDICRNQFDFFHLGRQPQIGVSLNLAWCLLADWRDLLHVVWTWNVELRSCFDH